MSGEIIGKVWFSEVKLLDYPVFRYKKLEDDDYGFAVLYDMVWPSKSIVKVKVTLFQLR